MQRSATIVPRLGWPTGLSVPTAPVATILPPLTAASLMATRLAFGLCPVATLQRALNPAAPHANDVLTISRPTLVPLG